MVKRWGSSGSNDSSSASHQSRAPFPHLIIQTDQNPLQTPTLPAPPLRLPIQPMIQHRHRTTLPQPQPASSATPNRRPQKQCSEPHHRHRQPDPPPSHKHETLTFKRRAEHRDRASRSAETVGHALGEFRGQAREAGWIFVIVPIKCLNHISVKEGFAAGDADGEVDDNV